MKKTLTLTIEIDEEEFEFTKDLISDFVNKGSEIRISSLIQIGEDDPGLIDVARGEVISCKLSPGIKKPGYVYFIRSEHGYKIGRTKNLHKRTTSIIGSLPFKAVLEAYVPTDDSVGLEKELHRKYKGQRVGGEWFEVSDAEVYEELDLHDEGEYLARGNLGKIEAMILVEAGNYHKGYLDEVDWVWPT